MHGTATQCINLKAVFFFIGICPVHFTAYLEVNDSRYLIKNSMKI